MSAIYVKCTSCGRLTESDDALYGSQLPCAYCNSRTEISCANIVLPEINAQPSKPAVKKCPACGEEILAVAVKCKHCGSLLPSYDELLRFKGATRISEKSRGIYVVLGLLFGFFGLHNFYAGHVVCGFIELVLFGVLSALILTIPVGQGFELLVAGFAILLLLEIVLTKVDGAGNIMR